MLTYPQKLRNTICCYIEHQNLIFSPGISPPQQRRAPSHIPAIFSVPIDSGYTSGPLEYTSSDSEEGTPTCFKLGTWANKAKKVYWEHPHLTKLLLKERVKQRSRPAAALEKVPSFCARRIDPRNKNISKTKVDNKSLKSESMSVLESDTNDRIISEKVLKYASNPEMSNPK